MAHVLQSWEWGDFKGRHGWTPHRLAWQSKGECVAAASVLVRRIRFPGFAARLAVVYVPRGPLLDWSHGELRSRVLSDLKDFSRRQGAIFLKIDPEVVDFAPHPPTPSPRRGEGGELAPLSPQGRGVGGEGEAAAARRAGAATPPLIPRPLPPFGGKGGSWLPSPLRGEGSGVRGDLTQALAASGWVFSREQVQFRNTVQLDLRRSEAELLAAMKPKTRYNIRLAEKKGVTVEAVDGSGQAVEPVLDLLYGMYAETSRRDGFVIRPREYYRDAWGGFIRAGLAQPLVARVDGEPVSAVILFTFAGKAWYMYGMSRAAHREKMPNHLLQWEAIRWAKAHGGAVYDFWGAPNEFVEADPMWGVWKFKEGFGGDVVRTPGAWDLPLSRPLYWLYTQAVPRALALMRLRQRSVVSSQ